MKQLICVEFKEDEVTVYCDGWWCNRCRCKFDCYTSRDNLVLEREELDLGERDVYDWTKIEIRVSMHLLGIESNSIYTSVNEQLEIGAI